MTVILVSLITSIIVSGICCIIYYRMEIAKQKVERRRKLEITKEELKETNPELYEILKDV